MPFLPEDYIEVQSPALLFPDFITHLHYLGCVKELSDGISISTNIQSAGQFAESSIVRKKVKLIELTYKNLVEEKRNIDQVHDYSMICVSWVPVKSYYLMFNLLLLLEYLIFENDDWLTAQHRDLCNKFRDQLKNRQISFSEHKMNMCYTAIEIESWTIPRSDNLRSTPASQDVRVKQIIKKLYEYKKEDFKRANKLKRLSGKKLKDFKNSCTLCLFDFFYWYRIKANYRDMEFVDSGVPIEQFYSFYSNYYLLTMNCYQAFKQLINQLSQEKLGREIL
ncbi:MAG: hypothetical protein WCO23_00680 [bacterium]